MKAVVLLKVEVLDEHIARRNLFRYQFARSAGISGCYFSQLMQRQKHPGQQARQKIIAATQAPPNQRGLDFDQLFEIRLASMPSQAARNAVPALGTATPMPAKSEVNSLCPTHQL